MTCSLRAEDEGEKSISVQLYGDSNRGKEGGKCGGDKVGSFCLSTNQFQLQ